MLENRLALPHQRNWKVKPYTVSPETRMAQERASKDQPALISLHGKSTALPRYDNDATKYNKFS